MAANARPLARMSGVSRPAKTIYASTCVAPIRSSLSLARQTPKQRLLSTSPRTLSDDTKPKSKKLRPLGRSVPNISAREANKFIIDQLTARPGPGAGAQQSRKGQPLRPGESLPLEYRPAARRVTLIIVTLPIVFVVGYMLYQRRFMGVERKDIRKGNDGDDSLLETAARPGVAGDEG